MDPGRIRRLEGRLRALANRCRLQLLLDLREPRRLKEIRLSSDRSWAWAHDARTITRQAVRHHLKALEEAGAVDARRRYGEETFVVNPAGIRALLDDLEDLASEFPEAGLGREASLLTLNGARRGAVHPIEAADEWVVGNGPGAALDLPGDASAADHHFAIVATGTGHAIRPLGGALAPTYLNARRLDPGDSTLVAGDVIGAGDTVFLYRRGLAAPRLELPVPLPVVR